MRAGLEPFRARNRRKHIVFLHKNEFVGRYFEKKLKFHLKQKHFISQRILALKIFEIILYSQRGKDNWLEYTYSYILYVYICVCYGLCLCWVLIGIRKHISDICVHCIILILLLFNKGIIVHMYIHNSPLM